MNKQAIEAGAIAVYNHDQPNHRAWPFNTADDWAKDGLRLRAQLVIEAARPHIEAELRQKIAEEIRNQPRNSKLAEAGMMYLGMDAAARIAEGKQ